MNDLSYEEALDFIFGLINYEKVSHNRAALNYDPRRIQLLMNRLDNPEKYCKTIHVAGTKGKGSTASMIAAILHHAYKKVGLFTSPHLVDPRERIVFDAEMISKNDLTEMVSEISSVISDINEEQEYGRITTFETLTALAFCYFRKKNAEYSVIEVGLGGRVDATNVVTPEVSVITTIALDHTDVLGDTIEKIATEKAGIIKPEIPVVSADQLLDADSVITDFANRNDSALYKVGADATYEIINPYNSKGKQEIVVHGLNDDYQIELPLLGEFQAKNCALAVLAIEVLDDENITKQDIEDGLAQIEWDGRFQIIKDNPFFVIDGAHNLISSQELKKALAIFEDISPKTLVIGLSDDKDYRGVLNELVPLFNMVIATKADNPRAMCPTTLKDVVDSLEKECIIADTVAEAIQIAREQTQDSGMICITGSLFVAGEAIKELNN